MNTKQQRILSEEKNLSSVIPDKLYFKIGEVAEIVGVKPYVLRYWETEFSDIAPGKSKTNQRLYKRKEVEKILKIRDLLYREKYTISGARKRLKEITKDGKLMVEEEKKEQIPLFSNVPNKDFLQTLKGQLEDLLSLMGAKG